jgi:hypothetical protein
MEGSCLLHVDFMLGLLNPEDGGDLRGIPPKRQSVDFQRIAQRYILDDGTLPDHRCEKSYKKSRGRESIGLNFVLFWIINMRF